MDSWVTDGFYSHFPSYSQQPSQRELLAKTRQLEYQTFLSRISPQKNISHAKLHQKRHTESQTKKPKEPINITLNTKNNELPKLDIHIVNENNSSQEKTAKGGNSTNRTKDRNAFVKGLEKMDLPDIFNDERISARNEKLAEEKRLRNMQYKQELMAQIEQKKLERELQRLKEEEEEQRLTKKMEEQLKSVRLQDGLDCDRQPHHYHEHHLISIELNKPKKLPATIHSERFEPNPYRAYDQRKAQSDNGKENVEVPKRSDKEIYNFFTNSGRRQIKDFRHSHYFDMDESSENDETISMSPSTYNTYPFKSSLRHNPNESRQALCHYCKHNRFLARNQEENLNSDYMCDACENDPICLNCRKEICVRCKRLTRNDENPTKQAFQLKHRKFENEAPDCKTTIEHPSKMKCGVVPVQPIQIDEDDSSSDQSSMVETKQPYSFNIDKSSLFHPSNGLVNPVKSRRRSVTIRNENVQLKPDSFDELKRITDEKMAKLSKTYAETIKANKLNESKDITLTTTIPTLNENTKRLIEFAKELERNDSNLYGREGRDGRDQAELKNQNSAIRKTIVEYGDANSTLIQIGAITKEIQSDRLNH